MKKELRPVHDVVPATSAGARSSRASAPRRTSRPAGSASTVCELCSRRAEHEGWIRESAAGDLPAALPRPEPRGRLLGRLRRRRAEPDGAGRDLRGAGDGHATTGPRAPSPEPSTRSRAAAAGAAAASAHATAGPAPRARGAHHREVKVERALELFNGSEHQRTIAGHRPLARRAVGHRRARSRTRRARWSSCVAWELSWYRYRVDLGDAGEPVLLLEKGDELDEIDEALRDWNATLDGTGGAGGTRTE